MGRKLEADLNFTLVVDPATDGPTVLDRLHPLRLVVLVVDTGLVDFLLADVLPLPPTPANGLILQSRVQCYKALFCQKYRRQNFEDS